MNQDPIDAIDLVALQGLLARAFEHIVWPPPSKASMTSLLVAPAAQPLAPSRLAAAHLGTPSDQSELRHVFERCLHLYRTKVRPDDRLDDLGAAAAFFVGANFLAFHGRSFEDRGGLIPESDVLVDQVSRQLQERVALVADWERASAQDRQFCFEQFAVLGVYVAEASVLAQQQGAAAVARLRDAGHRYLKDLLGVNPECVRLTEQGLSIRTIGDG